MHLDQVIANGQTTLSFELFPAKTDKAREQFESAAAGLAELQPDWISVTYGAGGTSRAGTKDALSHVINTFGIPSVAHLTCVGNTKDELRELFDEYHAAGIDNFLALRGDPPRGQDDWKPTPGGCLHADELIELIKEDGRFGIACAAFPEGHPESTTREEDWGYLLGKFDAGACVAATQCFFDVKPFEELLEWSLVESPNRLHIEAGIIVARSWPWCQNFVNRFSPGTSLPPALEAVLAPFGDDQEAAQEAGLNYTIDLCRAALKAGAPGLHLYCMNQAEDMKVIVNTLRAEGLLPTPAAREA